MTDWLAMFTRLMAEAINVVCVSVKYLKKNFGATVFTYFDQSISGKLARTIHIEESQNVQQSV